jgi:hypothetical protein
MTAVVNCQGRRYEYFVNQQSFVSPDDGRANCAAETYRGSKSVDPGRKGGNASEMFGQENELTFKIDRAAGIAVVRIVNKKTGALVQQIPNEQVLKLAEESSGR